jgi:dTDP-4-amino-4,6-dideoxygalactose transaminase
MAALRRLADRHGLHLIEDAAQAFGATYETPCRACPDPTACAAAPGSAAPGAPEPCAGRSVGALGDAAAFSFYPTKNLGALGDGGLLTTSDAAVAARVRRLRNHGSERRYHHEELGVNSRLDALQAAALRAKLPRLDAWTAARRAVARRYDVGLADVPGLTPPAATRGHVYHQYTIRIDDGRRDAVAEALRSAGVATMVYYPHTLERYGGRVAGPLTHAHAASAEALSLPIYPTLTPAAQDRVVAEVRRALAA